MNDIWFSAFEATATVVLGCYCVHCNTDLRHGDVVVRSVEDRFVVVLVLDVDGDGADILQGRFALVAGLHGHVDQLLSLGFVSVENLKISNIRELGNNSIWSVEKAGN